MIYGLNIQNLIALSALCAIFAFILLGIFKLRSVIGLNLFYLSLGLFKALHFFLARAFTVEIYPDINVSLGSTVIFTGIIFSLLLIYILEDALELRKVIYALIGINIIFAIFQIVFDYTIHLTGFHHSANFPAEVFNFNARIAITGVIIIFLDSFLIIYTYELVSNFVKSIYLKIFLSMTLVFFFHTIIFALGAFAFTQYFWLALYTSSLSKIAPLLVYSIIFGTYMKLFERGAKNIMVSEERFRDIFNFLTYKQKFEKLYEEAEKLLGEKEEQVRETERKFKTIFDTVAEAIIIFDSNTEEIVEVNRALINLYSFDDREELIGKKLNDFPFVKDYNYSNFLEYFNSAKEGIPQIFDWKAVSKDGEEFWVEISLKKAIIEGKEEIVSVQRDISERISFVEELKSYDARLKSFINNRNEAIWVYDRDLNLVLSNKYFDFFVKKLFNIELKEGDSLIDYVQKEFADLVVEYYRKTLEGEQSRFSTMFEIDNEARYFEVIFNPVISDGNVIGGSAFGMDITERKRDQERINELLERNQMILETMQDGFILADTTGEIVQVNPAYCEMVGYTNNELVGKNIVEMEAMLSPKEVGEKIKWMMKEGRVRFTSAHRHKSGRLVYLDVSISVVQNTETFVAAFVKDITEEIKIKKELLESEQKFRTIFEESLVGIVYYELEGKILDCNNKFAEMIGAKRDKIIGANALNIIQEHSLKKALSESLEIGYSFFEGYYTSVTGHKTGFYRMYFKGLRDEKGEIFAGLCVVDDLTDRKETEEALKDSEQFNKTIFKDSRTPLVIMDSENYQYIDCNQAAIDIYGFSSLEETLGKTPMDVSAQYQYDGRPSGEVAVERINEALEKGSVLFEWKHQRPDGTIWDAEVHLMKFNYKGKTLLQFSLLDITERKKILSELIESEAKFREVLSNIDSVIWAADMDGNFIYLNKAAEKIYGKSLEELLANPGFWLDCVHPDDKHLAEESREELFKNGETTKEYRIVNYRNQIINILDRKKIIYDENGKPVRITGTATDITKIKESEKQIRFQAKLLDSARNAIIATTEIRLEKKLNNIITYWNKAAEEMYGYKAEEVIGKPIRNFIPMEFENIDYDDVMHIVAENGSWEGETVQKNRWGETIIVYLSISGVYDDNGNLMGYFGINQDITQRKEMQEKLDQSRAMLAEAERIGQIGSWSYDYRTNEFIWSDAMYEVFEIPKDSKPKTMDEFVALIYEEDREIIRKLGREKALTSDTMEFQYRTKTPDGRIKYLFARTVIKKKKGELISLLGVVSDVTNWVETNEELRKSREMLRKLTDRLQYLIEEEKKNIAREMHDELGQLLTIHKIDLQSLLSNAKEWSEAKQKLQKQLVYLDKIITTSRHIMHQLRPQILDDLGLPSAVEWMVAELRKRTDLEINLIISPVEQVFPEKLAIAFYRIIQELLNNVVKHSNASLVTVELTRKGNIVNLRIEDNGKGFDITKVDTEKSIGLLGIQERVWLLGGTVNIDSKIGRGTKTVISINLDKLGINENSLN